jgi:hypothetical protein
MKRLQWIALLIFAGLATACAIAFGVHASAATDKDATDKDAAAVSGIELPSGYRDWRVVSVAHEAGNLNDLRAILGNDPAIKAYRDGTLPFPDGTIIARLAWAYTPSGENNKVFGREQSFVAGAATNIQLMVKDSKKYATTGGWGFAQFTNGKPAGEELIKTCYSCHIPAKAHDYVFTRYAP